MVDLSGVPDVPKSGGMRVVVSFDGANLKVENNAPMIVAIGLLEAAKAQMLKAALGPTTTVAASDSSGAPAVVNSKAIGLARTVA